MQDVVATLLGAGLVTTGLLLRYFIDKIKTPSQQNKELPMVNMAFAGELLCGHIETVAAEPDDPWSYQLEPCDQPAFVIIGGKTLCEDHRDVYISDMGQHT